MTETTAIYDILCLPILSITQHWPMWLTLLNDGFCQINEMWTSAVIMLLASIIFSCSWLSWWLIEAVVILSKVNRPKRIRCKLAFPYVSLKVHQNNMEKKGWLLQQDRWHISLSSTAGTHHFTKILWAWVGRYTFRSEYKVVKIKDAEAQWDIPVRLTRKYF